MTGVVTAVALVLALLLGAGTAQAQTSVKLVGNTGQTGPESSHEFSDDYAQAFTTGSHPSGYTLTRVDMEGVDLSATSPTYTVHIHSDSSNAPGTSLGALTNPASLPSTRSLIQFDAPTGGINLDPDTTYWVVVDVDTGTDETRGIATHSDNEDTAGRRVGPLRTYPLIGTTPAPVRGRSPPFP